LEDGYIIIKVRDGKFRKFKIIIIILDKKREGFTIMIEEEYYATNTLDY